MNLFTCCPKCQTTFRVTTQQLQSSGGQVRCGFCSQVFDAFSSLTAQEPRAETAATQIATESLSATEKPMPLGVAAADFVSEKTLTPPPRTDPAASLYEWEFRMPANPKRTGLWVVLSALLLITLAAQSAYVFRTELSLAWPQTRKPYEQVCAAIGCSMASPALSSFLHIEASDLKAVEAGPPNEIELTVSVRNRAPVDLAHPAIEFTLTDGEDQAIARRIFFPREYLSEAVIGTAIKPGEELPVHLFLNTGELRGAGYRLYLFYP